MTNEAAARVYRRPTFVRAGGLENTSLSFSFMDALAHAVRRELTVGACARISRAEFIAFSYIQCASRIIIVQEW